MMAVVGPRASAVKVGWVGGIAGRADCSPLGPTSNRLVLVNQQAEHQILMAVTLLGADALATSPGSLVSTTTSSAVGALARAPR